MLAAPRLLPAASRAALACSVCFGQGDNPDLPRAFTWGVVVLVAVTFCVLGAIVASIVRIESGRVHDGR